MQAWTPALLYSMRKLSLFIATGFGSGYLRPASGTWGTGVAMLLLWLGGSWWTAAGLLAQIIFCLAVFAVAVATSYTGEAHFKKKDPSPVVIDEIIGYFCTMIALPAEPLYLIAAFFLFRLLDILKPFPAHESQSLPSGWGIVVDDVLAGLYGCLCLHLARLIVF